MAAIGSIAELPKSLRRFEAELPEGIRRYEEDKQKEIKRASTLGQAEFLKLMTTQLQHQDPMKPMDNGEFLGQMAQFSTVAGITEMSTALKKMTETFDTQRMMQTVGLIGKDVLVNGTQAQLSSEKGLRGVIELETAANQVQVQITNSAGEVIHNLDLGQKFAGQHSFKWDGVLDNGEKAELGNYFVKAIAVNAAGAVEPKTMVYGLVEGVRFVKASSEVKVALEGRGEIDITEVTKITQ
jgi:flagellar basal-body rod modification protein FlgD